MTVFDPHDLDAVHRFGPWVSAFLYGGFLGQERVCRDCGHRDRTILGGYPSDRRNRIAAYLKRRLDRLDPVGRT